MLAGSGMPGRTANAGQTGQAILAHAGQTWHQHASSEYDCNGDNDPMPDNPTTSDPSRNSTLDDPGGVDLQ